MKKIPTFHDVYDLPLKLRWSKVMTNSFKMAFDFPFMRGMFSDDKNEILLEPENQQKIVDTINGTGTNYIDGLTYDKGMILLNGDLLIMIRGWGHLTGMGGGLGLDNEVAAKIQDDFGKFIISKLTK